MNINAKILLAATLIANIGMLPVGATSQTMPMGKAQKKDQRYAARPKITKKLRKKIVSTAAKKTLARQAEALERDTVAIEEAAHAIQAPINLPSVEAITKTLNAEKASMANQLALIQTQITKQGKMIQAQAQRIDEQKVNNEEQLKKIKKVIVIGSVAFGITMIGSTVGFVVLGTQAAALSNAVTSLRNIVENLAAQVDKHTILTTNLSNGLTNRFMKLGGRVRNLNATITDLGKSVEAHQKVLSSGFFTQAASWIGSCFE